MHLPILFLRQYRHPRDSEREKPNKEAENVCYQREKTNEIFMRLISFLRKEMRDEPSLYQIKRNKDKDLINLYF